MTNSAVLTLGSVDIIRTKESQGLTGLAESRVDEVDEDSETFFSEPENVKERPSPKGSEPCWAEPCQAPACARVGCSTRHALYERTMRTVLVMSLFRRD